MCSPEEVIQRRDVEVGSIERFEKMNQDAEMKGFEHLAVARYSRSAANKIIHASSVRPCIITYHTISYMRDCLMDQDRIPPGQSYYKYESGKNRHEFEHIYSFCRDRLRQIMQDLIRNKEVSVYDVRTTEEIVRFFIISYHDCF